MSKDCRFNKMGLSLNFVTLKTSKDIIQPSFLQVTASISSKARPPTTAFSMASSSFKPVSARTFSGSSFVQHSLSLVLILWCFLSDCQKLCSISHVTAFSTRSVMSVPSAVMTVCFSSPLWKSMCSISARAFFR